MSKPKPKSLRKPAALRKSADEAALHADVMKEPMFPQATKANQPEYVKTKEETGTLSQEAARARDEAGEILREWCGGLSIKPNPISKEKASGTGRRLVQDLSRQLRGIRHLPLECLDGVDLDRIKAAELALDGPDLLQEPLDHLLTVARRRALRPQKQDGDPYEAAKLIYLAARELYQLLMDVYEKRPELLTGLGSRHDSAPWLWKVGDGENALSRFLEHLEVDAARIRTPKNLPGGVMAEASDKILNAFIDARGPERFDLFTDHGGKSGTAPRVVQIHPASECPAARRREYKKLIDQGKWRLAAPLAPFPTKEKSKPKNPLWPLVKLILIDLYGAAFWEHEHFASEVHVYDRPYDKRSRIETDVWKRFIDRLQPPRNAR